MEKRYDAVLIASNGTLNQQAQFFFEAALRIEASSFFPKAQIFFCITSGKIALSLKASGSPVKTVEDALRQIALLGKVRLLVLPFFLTEGHEYKKLLAGLKQNAGIFSSVDVSKVLFCGESSVQTVAGILSKEEDFFESGQYLFACHGSEKHCPEHYGRFAECFAAFSGHKVYTAMLCGSPDIQSVLPQLEKQTVHLYPLMLMPGNHVKNEIFGEGAESMNSVLRNAGFNVNGHLKTLVSYPKLLHYFMELSGNSVAL